MEVQGGLKIQALPVSTSPEPIASPQAFMSFPCLPLSLLCSIPEGAFSCLTDEHRVVIFDLVVVASVRGDLAEVWSWFFYGQ